MADETKIQQNNYVRGNIEKVIINRVAVYSD